ncbi:hypothetical protein [Hymenobacter siberiensis]|uniref:hypothetical protein n=2 Tax=Hymenobacter siberiensis TaxID=2848396 RepID=UPI001D005D4A|nr:hypothetical protein [Hymenobacter siberiensis]
MNKKQQMIKGSLLMFGVLSLWSCETARPKTPPTYGGAVSQGLYEKGGSGVLPFLIQAISQDATYGFTANNPVRVGGGREAGLRNQQRYLNALLGPRGETLKYEHEGSCCAFKIAEVGIDNEGQLDVYSLTWKGQQQPLKLYLNMYEEGTLTAPVGLSTAR